SPTSRWPASTSSRSSTTRRGLCCSGSSSSSRGWRKRSSSSAASRSRPRTGTRRSRGSPPPARSLPITTARGARSARTTARRVETGKGGQKKKEAIEAYRSAVKANPDNPAFADKLADLLIRLGRLPEAQTELEGLAEATPQNPRAWMKLGAVYYEQKMWDKAV